MIVRRKTYKIDPEKMEEFHRFFHEYLLPNQQKHGARLIGRWMTEAQDEVMALWEYPSREAYEAIEERVRGDEMHLQARKWRKELGELYRESRQDFLIPTGSYSPPRKIVAACGFIQNERGEVLMVRSYWRSDTWEMPGGQVEEGEAPHEAMIREVREETGLDVEPTGFIGAYSNKNS